MIEFRINSVRTHEKKRDKPAYIFRSNMKEMSHSEIFSEKNLFRFVFSGQTYKVLFRKNKSGNRPVRMFPEKKLNIRNLQTDNTDKERLP